MRFLSGIQPSGKLHIGNYFGYVRPNMEAHETADAGFIMIADLHALTTVQDASVMRTSIDDMVKDLIACGFDPKKTTIFRQSDIMEHTELMWILSTVTPVGLLERAVSYKEKVAKGIAASLGLFSYPVLQAADVVLYDIDTVPVGKDQTQHLEMVRDIAIKFNNTFGETFVVPQGVVRAEVAVVPGTDGQKMSKSYGNTIPLFADEKTIKKAIMGIVTDSKEVADAKDPDSCVVYNIHKLFLSPAEAKTVADKYRAGGMGYGDAKKMLLETYMDFTAPMRAKRAELETDTNHVAEVIKQGAAKAGGIASKTMEKVRKAVGLRSNSKEPRQQEARAKK